MEVDGGDPAGVNKNPKLIRAAQDDISKLDVLVCGSCHHVFHFIEEFQQHKENQECENPTFKANLSETKPQVWAFLLWKSAVVAQQRPEDSKENLNSWKLYQKWCKMKESVRNSWVAAGKTIQSFSVLSNAKLQEIHKSSPDGKGKTVNLKPAENDENDVLKTSDDSKKNQEKKAARKTLHPVDKNGSIKDIKQVQNKDIKSFTSKNDIPCADETEKAPETQLELKESPPIKEKGGDSPEIVKNTEKQLDEQEKMESEEVQGEVMDKKSTLQPIETIEIKEEKLSEAEEEIVEEDTSLKVPCVESTTLPELEQKSDPNKKIENVIKSVAGKGMRPNINKGADEGSSEDEYVVEKILAKRFNPRRKYYEYLLKWEGYPHDQNTWEPVHNMAACDKLVETFERNLARQKAAQQQGKIMSAATPNQKPVSRTPKPQVKSIEPPVEPGNSGGIESRPVRSSKKKALAQVKSWCGSMAKKSDSELGGKRKAGEDSDTDDDDELSLPEKKVKLEPLDDDDWSSGDAGASSASSIHDDHEKQQHRNSANFSGKLLAVPKSKEQYLMGPTVKRSPGRPRKIRPQENTLNGVTIVQNKKDDADELAVKLGLESDSSPEHKTKLSQSNANKDSNASQPPVLVANSKGVIKVDPRQVPNLTSGVYIVSNKSGVVKLESVSGSPAVGKAVTSSQSVNNGSGETKTIVTQSGIIRKPVQSSGISRVAQGPGQVKLLSKTAGSVRPQGLSPGLVRVSPTGSHLKNFTPRLASPGQRPPLTSPRVLGPRLQSGTRPVSVLAARPGLANPVRPVLSPRIPGMLRAPLNAKKSSIGIPGVQTKIMRAVSPRVPVQGGKIMSSLSAQTRSGVKPIQAMLGKAVQGNNPVSSLATAKMKVGEDGNSNVSVKSVTQLTPSGASLQGRGNFDDDDDEEDEEEEEDDDDDEDYLNEEEERPGRSVGRGRGRRNAETSKVGDSDGNKQRDSKLVDTDGVHMEFHEVTTSESESDDSLPELPMGDLPSLEPDSPPRPFTLCPETGKILGRAEGEPTPPPSPETKSSGQSEPLPGDSGPPQEQEPEEILPDPRPSSPLNKETLLKVEMSPGGTTGTVVEGNENENSNYADPLRTEQGLTVTKIADSAAKNSQQGVNTTQVVTQTGKGGSGISVPARKLYVDGASGKMSGDIVTVTGEDGVVYQISTDGQQVSDESGQQCVYVSTEGGEGSEEGAVLTLDTAVAEAVAQLMPEQVNVIGGAGCSQFFIKGEDGTVVNQEGQERQQEQSQEEQQLVMTSMVDQQAADESQAQVVAHVVQEGELDPVTGKRRVVLLLPDGNLMMTDVDEEQYAALNLEEK
ncbi:uncharacterized protein LOC124789961 isoform X1 [Schistocerca piceifrons]|uniref:uncharacterized protein LOC124789961 isoform X1 n=1 Tax=Schistocerca piceifrons TaxID=274613 RepID=UPI001F5E9FC2|nr:uncharacterized protein LOC124789961 isoform X1 [Schistocerca piceifrons]XP_047113452.1 uncharacterized protein LOC124789961 isoform X1 [Schistocerca piceifrons]